MLILTKAIVHTRIFRQHPENEGTSIEQSLELIQRASRKISSRVNILANETMIETLQQTRNANQEMTKMQSEIAGLREGLSIAQSNQLETGENETSCYERQEKLAQAFVENINQNVQRSLSVYESHFRAGFSSMQLALEELMSYPQPLATNYGSNLQNMRKASLLSNNSWEVGYTDMHSQSWRSKIFSPSSPSTKSAGIHII